MTYNIRDKLENLKLESKGFCATPSNRFVYEVDNEYERHVVDLPRKACSCRLWDLNEIPCKHAVTIIYKNLEQPEEYVHPCYLKDAYKPTYKEIIPPLLGQNEWIKTGLPASIVPIVYKPPGRPPVLRKKGANESRNPNKMSRMYKSIRCGNCKLEGHNSRGCKTSKTSENPWERSVRLQRGRLVSDPSFNII